MDNTLDEITLLTFVRGERLVRLPARWNRKLTVLRYVADRAFERGASYSEQEVNDRLRRWCEGSREIDHVALRRYLVDLDLLVRDNDNCTYWVAEEG